MRFAPAILLGVVGVLASTAADAQTWEREFTRGPGEGLPFGFVEGLGTLVVRELVGVSEFVTAPLPAPEDFRTILEPEFPWDYFAAPPASAVDDDES